MNSNLCTLPLFLFRRDIHKCEQHFFFVSLLLVQHTIFPLHIHALSHPVYRPPSYKSTDLDPILNIKC